MVCFLYFEVNRNKEGFERADRRHKKNSKNIAVVVDSIVCCHTAPACRKANALVRGNPSRSPDRVAFEPTALLFLYQGKLQVL